MVTHGIDEAVLLADRIVVMANPPQPSVADVLPVPIARPRDRVSIVDEPGYRAIQERLMALLTADSAHAGRARKRGAGPSGSARRRRHALRNR